MYRRLPSGGLETNSNCGVARIPSQPQVAHDVGTVLKKKNVPSGKPNIMRPNLQHKDQPIRTGESLVDERTDPSFPKDARSIRPRRQPSSTRYRHAIDTVRSFVRFRVIFGLV